MKIEEITVHAGRTVNHPFESYSNLRPAISLRATLDEGEDPEKATKELQAKAERLVEDHKNHMIESLENLYEMRENQRQIANLEHEIKNGQDRLESLRKRRDQLTLPMETQNS